MLAKSKRLNLKKDFKWVAQGKKIDTQFAKIFIRFGDPSKSLGSKVGIAVSSSLFKKATQRNRARRLVSAALETLYASFPQSINIIALPKYGVLEVKSADVLLDLQVALRNEKVIN